MVRDVRVGTAVGMVGGADDASCCTGAHHRLRADERRQQVPGQQAQVMNGHTNVRACYGFKNVLKINVVSF